MNDNEVKCPHCGYVCDIGGLIGDTTDDCPKCGGRVLGGVNPTGLNAGRRKALALEADIAQADALMQEIADHMKQAESVIEAQTLAALMTHALIHKTFFQAVQTMRSKP